MPSPERWLAMWHALGGQPPGQLYDNVAARYSEPHRHYHTARHLDECFCHFGDIGHLAAHPAEVELALWFDDAIYEPRRQDNEERSADWARASAIAAGVSVASADRVHALVMATRHDAALRRIRARGTRRVRLGTGFPLPREAQRSPAGVSRARGDLQHRADARAPRSASTREPRPLAR